MQRIEKSKKLFFYNLRTGYRNPERLWLEFTLKILMLSIEQFYYINLYYWS